MAILRRPKRRETRPELSGYKRSKAQTVKPDEDGRVSQYTKSNSDSGLIEYLSAGDKI